MNNTKTEKHHTSLRLPKSWHQFVKKFAEDWDTKPSYVYRVAIKEFLKSKSVQFK